LYHLEKEIAELYQGSDPVAVYYTKLKKLWDEMTDMLDVSVCTCPATCPSVKKNQELDQRRKLMQFLMHLNDEYEAIRGQILLLDPLPTVNKAYSMIQRVERQRHVTHTTAVSREVAACIKAAPSDSGDLENVTALDAKGRGRKDMRKSKFTKVCEYCQKPGHERDQCFKLIGYPEWYDDFKGKKKSAGSRLAAHVSSTFDGQETPLGEDFSVHKPSFDSSLIQALAQEVVKLTRGRQASCEAKNGAFANFAGKPVFTGFSSVCCFSQHGLQASWIVDTGASDHMSYDLTLFDKLVPLPQTVYVTLPDGSVKDVTQGGNVQLGGNFILQRVLYVPEFKFNLLSVTKLLADQSICLHVYSSACLFQDLTTNQVVAVAHEHHGLYTLGFSGSKDIGEQSASAEGSQEDKAVPSCFNACSKLSLEVLHARLGHTSLSKMKYIPDCKDLLWMVFSVKLVFWPRHIVFLF